MKVFISHDRQDWRWADQLREYLIELGVDAWSDHELLPGDNWLSETGKALEDSDALLVLISPASVHSEFLRREVQFALGREKFEGRVVPVIVEPTDEMPWILSKFQSVSGTPSEAARQVAQILSSSSPQASPARADSR